jgi:hypothetical protein
MFYRIRSAQQVPPEFQGKIGTFSDIFFRNVTICKKSAKNAKKRKMQKCPENTEILGVFIENRLWRFVEALKSVENDTEIPCTPSTFFSEIREAFRGFSGLST